MKKSGKKVEIKDNIYDSLLSEGKEFYKQLPVHNRERYIRFVKLMRAMPPKKVKIIYDVSVKRLKPLLFKLKAEFETRQKAHEIPSHVTFIEYFDEFQQAADREFRKTHGGKSVIEHLKSLKQKKLTSHAAHKDQAKIKQPTRNKQAERLKKSSKEMIMLVDPTAPYGRPKRKSKWPRILDMSNHAPYGVAAKRVEVPI